MSCVIEESLTRGFQGFRDAVLRGDLDSVERLGYSDERVPGVVKPRLEALKPLMSLRVDAYSSIGSALESLAEALPPCYWYPVILVFSGAQDRARAQEQLAATGVPLDDSGRGRYLKHVNMIRVPVPPIHSALDWLCRFEGVVLLGDGSRRITVPPLPGLTIQMPVGPWQAMNILMIGSQGRSFDINRLKQSVRVAIIDTGIDAEHPAFDGVVERQVDLAQTGLGPVDPVGHGTYVAGIIAGRPPEGRPELSGVAPFASLVDLQVWTPSGLPLDVLLDAVGAAIEERVDVLNISLGGHEATTGKSILSMAVQSAAQHGIICCVAAGNDGDTEYRRISTPGDAPDAIMVAATTLDGRRAEFSSMGPSDNPEYTGPKPNVAAPGCGVISARSQFSMAEAVGPDCRYAVMHGTSVATPMIAGVAALGIAALHMTGKGIDGIDGVRRFRSVLAASCRDMFSEGGDSVGAGIPQLPVLLDNLGCPFDDITGRFSAVHVPLSPSAQLASSQSHPAVDASTRDETRGLNWEGYRDTEQRFIAAIRCNVQQHTRDMVRELAGTESLPVSDDMIELRNEAMAIRTEAIRAGVEFEDRALPDNSELWITIRGRKFMGARPVFYLGIKSIAAWMAFKDLGKMTWGHIAQKISDYTTRQRKEAGETPCAFVLFSPKPWDPEVVASSPSDARAPLFWCFHTETGQNGSWFSLENRDVGWHTWKALTPMTEQFRLQWCRDRLLEQTELLIPGGIIALDDLAVGLGLSETVTEHLVQEIEKQGRGQFLLESGSSGKQYVQRAGV
ncbi:MAG: S8 family serine peptidase [Phycisphaerae bacterium]|nr:S8 family serine peptidase [Phycisphaerae bacterium]